MPGVINSGTVPASNSKAVLSDPYSEVGYNLADAQAVLSMVLYGITDDKGNFTMEASAFVMDIEALGRSLTVVQDKLTAAERAFKKMSMGFILPKVAVRG